MWGNGEYGCGCFNLLVLLTVFDCIGLLVLSPSYFLAVHRRHDCDLYGYDIGRLLEFSFFFFLFADRSSKGKKENFPVSG